MDINHFQEKQKEYESIKENILSLRDKILENNKRYLTFQQMLNFEQERLSSLKKEIGDILNGLEDKA